MVRLAPLWLKPLTQIKHTSVCKDHANQTRLHKLSSVLTPLWIFKLHCLPDCVASFDTILWAPACFNLLDSNEAQKSVFLTYPQDVLRLLLQGTLGELLFCVPVLSGTSRTESVVTSQPVLCASPHSRVPHCPRLLCAWYTHQSTCLLAQSLPV